LRDPALPWPAQTFAVRPTILDDADEATIQSTNPSSGRSLVYGTLGTVFNLESGDLLERLAVALDRRDRDALLTVGPHVDVDRLAAATPNVRIESFADHSEVFRRAAAVVFHGGSGTLVDALALGVPVVVLPMGADQPDNADRCAELGVGIVLDALTANTDEIATSIDRVIDEPSFAAAATAIADEARQQPRLADVDELVECLTPA
jgi:MGT family glycosyltransferase